MSNNRRPIAELEELLRQLNRMAPNESGYIVETMDELKCAEHEGDSYVSIGTITRTSLNVYQCESCDDSAYDCLYCGIVYGLPKENKGEISCWACNGVLNHK